jgi:hypothetical protein
MGGNFGPEESANRRGGRRSGLAPRCGSYFLVSQPASEWALA